jgi:transposase
MNQELTNNNDAAPEIVACIGLDWGDQSHAFAIQAGSNSALETGTVPNSPEALHLWLQNLGRRFAGRPVALALETSRGPLIHVLSAYAWLQVYPIHPATSKRYREAFVPSGAKKDEPDALVLLELVQWHRRKLRLLEPQDELTRKLAALVELRRDLVDRRTQIVNQLIALLKSYYPQALSLAGEKLTTPMALDFLERWPDLLALKLTRPSTFTRFYYSHGVRSGELVGQRLELIRNAVALTTDPAVLEPARLQLEVLTALLRVFAKKIPPLEQEIEQLFLSHPEACLFRDLPGAGEALRPRLLVAFGTDRTLYPEAAALQKFAGVAPVIVESGHQRWVHWRWQANRFLRQSFVEWVGKTVISCLWAKAYYEQMKARGKTHHVILRALAYKWIRILWKCWQTGQPYNEQIYLQRLITRKSPYAVKIYS